MLTTRESKFIDEFLVDGNGSRAAVAAGYAAGASSRVTASRLLARDNIRVALEARRAEDRERLRIDRETVLVGLLTAIEDATRLGDPGAQIAGWREIGKMLGIFAPVRTSLTLPEPLAARLQAMEGLSDRELLGLAGAA